MTPLEIDLVVAIRSRGRSVVIETKSKDEIAPLLEKTLSNLGLHGHQVLDSSNPEDLAYIELLPGMKSLGTIVIENAQHLPQPLMDEFGSWMKLMADDDDHTTKIIMIGHPGVANALLRDNSDLGSRMTTLRV